jgi:2-polyprenyl-3-methyl-5-hydroxy-6-metoxy-1,4-benzoquinol methylase
MLGSLYWRIRRRAGSVYRKWVRGVPDEQVWFEPEDVESLRATFYASGSGAGPEWEPFRHAHLMLPAWFRHGLDPWSPAYREQQTRLWSLIAGVAEPYDPHHHEKEAPWGDVDAVRQPGFYLRRDPAAVAAASDHWLATGMLLKHSGLRAGDRALEYGAGFGQTALALGRLGVEVETVDISETFCRFVQAQAQFFQVPLRPHHGEFGWNPVEGRQYQLIWFYESFHHCLAFDTVVPALRSMLAPGAVSSWAESR